MQFEQRKLVELLGKGDRYYYQHSYQGTSEACLEHVFALSGKELALVIVFHPSIYHIGGSGV